MTLLLNCVAPRQRCTMLSPNAILMTRFMTGKGLDANESLRPGMRQTVTHSPKSSCKNIRFETSVQRIWTEVPQAGTKATSDSYKEKETGPCQTSSTLDSLSGRKYCFLTNAPCSSLYLATCTLGVLTRNVL